MSHMLEVVTGPMEGTSYSLEEGTTLSLGRSSQNDITLPYDPWISSAHATLKCKDDTVMVMDLHSSNGSYMQGKKITPNTYVALREYLVLGSTLCRIATRANTTQRKPLAIKKSAAKSFLANTLSREALRIARENRSPTLSLLHLFMAALRLDNPELSRFLRSMKQDPDKLFTRLEKYRVFTGSREWINDFLVYQFKTKEDTACYITPLVQDYLERFSADPFDPIAFIKSAMREPFNILHPMLGVQGRDNDESMPGFTEKVTLNPYSSDDNHIILPKSFWTDLQTALEKKGPIIFSGSQGSGKTAILRHCFHALPKVDVPQFHSSEKRIFDPEIFLTFNELSDLTPYLNIIIKQLRGEQLIAIDHFGFLLQLLERNHVEASPLIGSIKRRHEPTLVCVRAEHLEETQEYFPKATVIDLDGYLEKVKLDILKSIVLDFESEVRCPIGEDAGVFLKETLLQHYNMASIRAFFRFCVERMSSLSAMYRDEMSDKKDKALSLAFFKSNLDHWASPFRPSGDHRHPGITTAAPAIPALREEAGTSIGLALRLEDMLRRFLQDHLRTELIYEDGSRSLADHSDKEAAPAYLVTYLDSLLNGFGSGFQSWLESFLMEIAPDRAEGSDAAACWEDFVSWYESLDRGFARDHFMESTRKALKRALRQKTLY